MHFHTRLLAKNNTFTTCFNQCLFEGHKIRLVDPTRVYKLFHRKVNKKASSIQKQIHETYIIDQCIT